MISQTQWQEHTSVISLCFKAGHCVSAVLSSYWDLEYGSYYTVYKHMDVRYVTSPVVFLRVFSVLYLKHNVKLLQLLRVWILAGRTLFTLYLRRGVWDFPRQLILVMSTLEATDQAISGASPPAVATGLTAAARPEKDLFGLFLRDEGNTQPQICVWEAVSGRLFLAELLSVSPRKSLKIVSVDLAPFSPRWCL